MRYLWMPRLVERIQAAATATATTTNSSSPTLSTITTTTVTATNTHDDNMKMGLSTPPASSSSDSFGTQVSELSDYYQPPQLGSNYCITSPSAGLFFPQGMDFQTTVVEPNTPWMMIQSGGDSSDSFWNAENMLFLQQQLMNQLVKTCEKHWSEKEGEFSKKKGRGSFEIQRIERIETSNKINSYVGHMARRIDLCMFNIYKSETVN